MVKKRGPAPLFYFSHSITFAPNKFRISKNENKIFGRAIDYGPCDRNIM